jgi:hypothetical protein
MDCPFVHSFSHPYGEAIYNTYFEEALRQDGSLTDEEFCNSKDLLNDSYSCEEDFPEAVFRGDLVKIQRDRR